MDEKYTQRSSELAGMAANLVLYARTKLKFHVHDIVAIPGPRAAVLELDAGLNTGDLMTALSSKDMAALRHLVPWDFDGHPVAYFQGKRLRVEAQWPSGLQSDDIKLEQVCDKPYGDGRWVTGVSERGGTVITALTDNIPHYLFAGATGSGKSWALRSAVYQLARSRDHSLVLIDGKFGDGLGIVAGMPRVVGPLATSVDDATAALKWVYGQMKARYEKGSEYTAAQRRIVVVIDEVQEFTGHSGDDAIVDLVGKLAAQGRGAKVHLMVGTQHPTIDMFSRSDTRRNLRGRVVLKVEDQTASQVACGTTEVRADQILTGKGDALVISPSHLHRVQVAYVPPDMLRGANGHDPMHDEWPDVQFSELDDRFSPERVAAAIEAAASNKGRPYLQQRTGLGSTAVRPLLRYGREILKHLDLRRLCDEINDSGCTG